MTQKLPEVVHKVSFPITWQNDVKPSHVTLPAGKIVDVWYMKDGKIMFDNGDVGTFTWTLDDKETGWKRIQVEMEK